jgi:hypothetical protein
MHLVKGHLAKKTAPKGAAVYLFQKWGFHIMRLGAVW